MSLKDINIVTRYTTYLLNTELSLTDIHIKRTKVIKSHSNKTLVFVEPECANQRIKEFKNKHFLKNMLPRSFTSLPIYIHIALRK